MHLSQDGFTVSFGDADTPAPPAMVDRTVPASLTVSVTPASPTNAVDVVYWVDDGLPRTLSAWEVHTDYASRRQLFRAAFPRFIRGKRVDYCPVARCAGGVQVPPPGRERDLTATFTLIDAPRPTKGPGLTGQPQFEAELTRIARARFELEPPYVFGETPEGYHLDFQSPGGTLEGAPLTGVIGDDSLVELRVRPDAIGIAEMHWVARTQHDELVSLTLSGKIDFGAEGYDRVVRGLRGAGPFEMMAVIETGSPHLAWLNRVSVLAIGRFDMGRRVVTCDLVLAKAASLS